jgi:hypothetical protein
VVLLALDAVGRGAEVVDRLLQLLLDVLVRGDTRGDRRHPALADELVVDLARGRERGEQVVAHVLVGHGALDVRPHLLDPILRLGHPRSVLSSFWSPFPAPW